MEAAVLAPVVVEANNLPNHETKVAMVVLAAAVAMGVGGFNYCQETKLSRRGEPEKSPGSYKLQQICKLSQVQWWQGPADLEKTCFRQCSCVWTKKKTSRTIFVTNCTIGYFSFYSVGSVKHFNKGF